MDALVYSITTYRDGPPSVWYPGLARNAAWREAQRVARRRRRLTLAGDFLGAALLGVAFYVGLLVTP